VIALSIVAGQLTLTGILSWWLCRQFINPDSPFHLLDHPNERSLHHTPIPRSGGIAMIIAIMCGMLLTPFSYSESVWLLVGGSLVISAVSMADDWFDLPASVRLLVHMAASVWVVFGLDVDTSIFVNHWVGLLFFTLSTIWLINLYNFMDGMDGFAGGMGAIGFSLFAIAGVFHTDIEFSLVAILIAAANVGFLRFNFPPAKIFMGDAGSATMGFLVAGLSMWGLSLNLFELWFPLLVFSPFIFDATATLIRRALKGEKVWQAHREHYYQRLALAGWGHKKTVVHEYILMFFVGMSAIGMLCWSEAVMIGLGFWALVYSLLAYKADMFCKKNMEGKL